MKNIHLVFLNKKKTFSKTFLASVNVPAPHFHVQNLWAIRPVKTGHTCHMHKNYGGKKI